MCDRSKTQEQAGSPSSPQYCAPTILLKLPGNSSSSWNRNRNVACLHSFLARTLNRCLCSRSVSFGRGSRLGYNTVVLHAVHGEPPLLLGAHWDHEPRWCSAEGGSASGGRFGCPQPTVFAGISINGNALGTAHSTPIRIKERIRVNKTTEFSMNFQSGVMGHLNGRDGSPSRTRRNCGLEPANAKVGIPCQAQVQSRNARQRSSGGHS